MIGVGDWRMTGVGTGVLLVAMAIQGLTPDCGSLASSWLLRVVSSWSTDGLIEEGDPSSRPSPPRDDVGDPGETWGTVGANIASRIRLDDQGPLLSMLLPAGLLERPARPACRSLLPASPVVRGPGGLISALCRFVC